MLTLKDWDDFQPQPIVPLFSLLHVTGACELPLPKLKIRRVSH